MRHGSLFSGIGGFDLAAEWMGWENVFHCEWMPFPRQVLHYHFPNSISYEDITKTDFTIHRGNIDLISGGFPCQPYSHAGKRLGKDDERHLWPHMLRAIQEINPTYVVGENVRGLTNWNGGLVFEDVCADLEACGYEVQPILLAAASVGAPHRRERIWFIAANTNRIRCEQRRVQINSTDGRINALNDIDKNDEEGISSNTSDKRLQGCKKFGITQEIWKRGEKQPTRLFCSSWEKFPTQPPICGGDDGLPTELDGITFSKWRQESIKGYGNAIVPQVVYEIFKVIQQLDGNTISR